jgi:pilus assembly protein CpaF
VPPIEEIRFSDGTKVHIVMPPLAPQGPILTVRKPAPGFAQLNDLVGSGMMTAAMADLLGHAVDAGRNILVAGASEAARTTLLGALGARIPEGVRTVLLENSGAMNLPQSSVVRLEAGSGQRTSFDMGYLCRAAVKMAPERIILNAISGGEAYEWATLAAGATFGSMAAITGVHAKDALERLEALAQLGGSQGSARAMRSQIARAVHLVAVVHRGPDGKERIHQISEVQGVDFDAYRVSDIFYARTENGQTSFVTTGYVPSFYELLRSSGVNVDTGIFHT